MLPLVPDGRGRGMRQQDVAELAGVSVKYYSEIERGLKTVSAALADKIASALQMSEAERSALHVLAAGHDPPRLVSRVADGPAPEPGQALRDIVDQQGRYPAALTDEMWTLVYYNESLAAWSGGWYERAPVPNMVLYLFSEQAEADLPDVKELRRFSLAALRYQWTRNLSSPRAGELVSRLLTHPEARKLWDLHEVVIPPHEAPARLRHRGSSSTVDGHVLFTPIHPELWLYIMHLPPVDPPAA